MGIPKNKYFTCKLKIDEIYLNLGIAKAALQPHSSTFYDLNKSGLPMSKIKNLAFLSAIISFTFTLNSHAADNCIITAPATNVNLNYAQAGRVSADFNNCKIRVRPSFQWSNPAGNSSVFRLDGKPDVYIPVSFYSRIGGDWDGNYPVVGASMTAANAYADF